jgi:cation transport regulator ChaC
MTDRLWYFAYGSNLDPDRFRSRVGEWRELRRARLDGYALRFCSDVQSEGGAGAVIVPDAVASVYGAVYGISGQQMAAMDGEEFDPDRDLASLGARRTVTVVTDGGPVTAEVYYVREPASFGPPSDVYLGHITRGLRAVAHDAQIIAQVEQIAAAEGA